MVIDELRTPALAVVAGILLGLMLKAAFGLL